MRGHLKVSHCGICGSEVKPGAACCTLCSKLYANVKTMKYAKGMDKEDLINKVKNLPQWKKFRGGVPSSPDGVLA
jgi:hypothetical protein